MLVLSRKQDQSLRIGNNIEITICRLQGNRVSLAISAPIDVPIMRGELLKEAKDKQDPIQLPGESGQAPQLSLLP